LSEAKNDLEEHSDERSGIEVATALYMGNAWFLCIIECRTGDLYVGIAKDVDERLKEHNVGRACRYTKFRRPVRLLYTEPCKDYSQARVREKQVKKFGRKKKLLLVGK